MSATVNLKISGMTCGSCSYKIESEVGDLPGVREAKVDLENKSGKFTYDPNGANGAQEIIDFINKLGFQAELVSEYKFV